MTQTCKDPAAGEAAGPVELSSSAADGSKYSPHNSEKQATIAALNREYEAEAARLQAIQSARAASTMFSHLGDYLALHMLAEADRSLESARQFGREVAQNLNRLHKTIDADDEEAVL